MFQENNRTSLPPKKYQPEDCIPREHEFIWTSFVMTLILKMKMELKNEDLVHMFFLFIFSIRYPETNMAPENTPLEKEVPIENHHF